MRLPLLCGLLLVLLFVSTAYALPAVAAIGEGSGGHDVRAGAAGMTGRKICAIAAGIVGGLLLVWYIVFCCRS